ncbi:unnamed protein product [Durusdinium trenchii]|uniref:Uncharacterized protein n=1 Tax=Durusdinium trenchii TaxID=1381693 RepID=A0ABP0MSD9_9DINO
MKPFVACFVLVLPAAAYPSSMNYCDHNCMAAKTPGGSFGSMGIATFSDPITDAGCKITTDVPSAGFTSGTAYTVTVTSANALAQRVSCSTGSFGNAAYANIGYKVTTMGHSWTAPSSGTEASFVALCGDSSIMNLAATVTVSAATTTSTTAMSTTTTSADTTATTTDADTSTAATTDADTSTSATTSVAGTSTVGMTSSTVGQMSGGAAQATATLLSSIFMTYFLRI